MGPPPRVRMRCGHEDPTSYCETATSARGLLPCLGGCGPAVNTGVQASLGHGDFVSFGFTPTSGTPGPYGGPIARV